jgi:DNA-binding NarL/FixJ family response regulator
MYIVFVDDTAADRQRVASCTPVGNFERVEPYSTPAELNDLLERIAKREQEEPALILLDMAIGNDEECGLEMLKRVRQAIPHMPVIIVSQSGMKPLITESYRYGACSYIQKSVLPESFEQKIVKMLKYWQNISKIPATAEAEAEAD